MPFRFSVSPWLLTAAVLSTAFVGTTEATLAVSVKQHASAAPEILTTPPENSHDRLSQVPSVDQLSDVQPSDWAFSALQSLVERYGCIAGYPNRTYQGNRPLARYEFAAGLSACLDRINELIASSQSETVNKADLETLQRLQTEFTTELTTLRGRVDAVEAQMAQLETHQFSTTTKLEGEAIFSVTDVFGADIASTNSTTAQYQVNLDFITSFNGSDRLTAELEAGNFTAFNAPTAESAFGNQLDLAYTAETQNQLSVGHVEYIYPLNDNIEVYIEATGGSITDIVSSISPVDDGSQGALSSFSYNPIYDVGDQSTGIGATVQLGDRINFGVGYLAAEGSRANPGSGLFNGGYSAFGQLTLMPIEPLTLGLTYVNSYAGDPATISNAYGVEANYVLGDAVEIGGWVGYIDTRVMTDPAEMGNGRTWTYAGTLLFHNVGKEDNDLGFVVGVPPRQTEFRFSNPLEAEASTRQEDASLQIEGYYRYQLTDNISITPGIIWISDPGNDNSNRDIFVGAIRTTFSF
jgi:hypothetical protein